jgi:hypothetical protein
MGQLINSSADIGKIEEHVRTAHRRGLAKGKAVGELARTRLGTAVADIDVALAAHRTAFEAEASARAALAVANEQADIAIGTVRDDLWNALGRPRHNAFLELVFPEGMAMYTQGEPRLKPVLMQVLIAHVQGAPPELFSKEKVTAWVTELEASRKAYQEAAEAHRPTEASALMTRFGYRGAVRAGLARMRDFKRDLRTLGLSETSIHEIIPDASRPSTPETPAPVQPETPVGRAA